MAISINIIEQGLSRAWGGSGWGGPGPGPSVVVPGPQMPGIYKQGALCVDLRLAVLTSSGFLFFVRVDFCKAKLGDLVEANFV